MATNMDLVQLVQVNNGKAVTSWKKSVHYQLNCLVSGECRIFDGRLILYCRKTNKQTKPYPLDRVF